MSSARGSGVPRGRGRGSTQPGLRGRGRGAATPQGRVSNNVASLRGASTPRAGAGFGQRGRGGTGQAARGTSDTHGNTFAQATPVRASIGGSKVAGGSWQERYQQLTKAREREREDAIRTGLVADPDKPRALSDAITPVGTCHDMCAEFERVQRVVQDDVWAEEKDARGEADESRMVKKFRRSAAGLEEQLPSDLRSPEVLKQTCDYLFNEVIGNADSLAQVHHFVWDRTRAIRNDFSIQQLTKQDELRIAVECYERIARFHILSLHQLASPKRPYAKYDWSQEREQLDRTLLSLVQYYEDARSRIAFPNEAEFRAYCIIFQLRSPTPDLEDTVQTWPRNVLQDQRVGKALDLYAAGCTVMGLEGPLNPKASHLVARQDWQRFWMLCASNQVSYLMGCVSEVYFNSIRRMVLNALFRTFRAGSSKPTVEWTLDILCDLLALEDEDEVQTYCAYFGFEFKINETGQSYLELGSVSGRVLPQPNAEMPNQLKSMLVENKRLGRTLPSVISGMTVQQAQEAGLVVEEEHDEGMEDVGAGGEGFGDQAADEDEDSLFIPEKASVQPTGSASEGLGKPSLFTWGKPSATASSPFSAPDPAAQSASSDSRPKFDFLGNASKAGPANTQSKPTFDFLGAAKKPAEKATEGSSGFNFLQPSRKGLDAAADSKPAFNFLGGAAPTAPTAPSFSFPSTLQNASAATSPNKDEATLDPTNKDATTSAKGPSETTAQQTSLFSKPAQERTATPGLFNFTAPPPPKPLGDHGHGIQLTADTKPVSSTQPSSLATATAAPASTSPQSPFNPFLQPPPKSTAQTPSETTPSFSSQQTKQAQPAQPHFIAPSSDNQTSPANKAPASPSNLNTNLRRPSTSTDTRPKKPSPLSNSFTATEEANAPAREPPITAAKANVSDNSLTNGSPSTHQPVHPNALQSSAHTPSVDERHLKAPVPFKRPRQSSEDALESFDATVTRIAKELVDDPVSGYLKQYVEYRASQIITSVQEQIAAENMKLRLSELRISTLYRKYFKRWISFVWQRRLAKSGKDRRQRRRKRLEEGFDDGSSHAAESLTGSRAASVLGGSSWQDHQGSVDAMFQRTMNSKALARSSIGDQQARAGSKRPSSSRGENGIAPKASMHKRLKSTSHVDDRGRVTKPSSVDHSVDDILKRSSFLGFSVNGSSPPSKNTTKSNYFKLKAMGVHRADELSGARGTKRLRTESTQPVETSPPALRRSSSTVASPEYSETRSLMPPPSETTSRAQKAKEEDDALFARLRAARESLTVGAVYMRSEVEKEEENRRSLSASLSSNESPSMARARADAKFRASHNGLDVPAYRLRESKFVPRDQYDKAIERSKQMRESRSRDTSQPATRPASRTSHTHSTQGFSFSPMVHHANSSANAPDYRDSSEHSKQPIQDSPSLLRPSTGFSQITAAPGIPGFANRTADGPPPFPHFQQQTAQQMNDGTTAKHDPFRTISGQASAHTEQDGFGAGSAFGHYIEKNAQLPAFGSQSLVGTQPADSNPSRSAFGSMSKPTLGGLPGPAAFAPQDHTIQPEFIDQSLADSFGSNHEALGESAQPSYENSTHHASYVNSQAISLLSDDGDDGSNAPAAPYFGFQANGVNNATGDEELLEDATDEDNFQASDVHPNPFAVLAKQGAYNVSGSSSGGIDDEMYDQDEFEQKLGQYDDGFEGQQEYVNEAQGGYQDGYYGGDDEDGVNGDIDEVSDMDGEEEGEEGSGYDSEEDGEEGEEEEDDEEEEGPPQPWRKVEYADPWRAKPTPNPALQGMGKTEDAPIELDSD